MRWFHPDRKQGALLVVIAIIIFAFPSPLFSQSLAYSPLSWLDLKLPVPETRSLVAASFGALNNVRWSFARTLAGLFGWFGPEPKPAEPATPPPIAAPAVSPTPLPFNSGSAPRSLAPSPSVVVVKSAPNPNYVTVAQLAGLTQAVNDIRRLLSQQSPVGLLALVNQQAVSIQQLKQKMERQTDAIYNSVSQNVTSVVDSGTLTDTSLVNPTLSTPTVSDQLTVSGSTGTSTFAGNLQVSGLFKVGDSSLYFNDTNNSITSTADLIIQSSGNNSLVLNPTSSGNIGIGTTSPYARLSVVGPVVSEYFHATSTAATSTFAGGALFTRAPTIAHTFSPWAIGTANSSFTNASLVINPASAVADSNLLSLAVGGSIKFLVDTEGDVFTNNLTTAGSVSQGETTISTLTVENGTNLGDAVGDNISFFGRVNTDLVPSAANTYNLGTTSTAWLPWKSGFFGTSVGIAGTATSTGANLLAAAAYLIDSGGTLSINTTNNQVVTFGNGQVTAPYASSTALTVSGTAYIGSLTGPLQAIGGTVSASSTLSVAYGGTGATTFGQGWLYSSGGAGALAASTSPTVNYVTATSTTIASTLPYASSTALTISGTAYIGSLTGPLQAISGAVSASSTLSIVYGGTGATTATGALNNFLPSQTSNSGKYLTTNGTDSSWSTVASSQWTTSGNDIYYNTGNVSIGTSTPYTTKLTVWGAGTGTNILANFVNNASTSLLTILENGNVGIGTTTLSAYDFSVAKKTTALNSGADGSLGAWATNSVTLPTTLRNFASVTVNGYIYVLGGDSGNVKQSAVYYSKINSDGSLGSWTTNANALPATLQSPSSVVANGYVYVLGGTTGTVQATVYYSKINSDGSLGSWTTNANALLAARYAGSAVVANGHVYFMGGKNTSDQSQSNVYYAKLNADGSIGVWLSANSLTVDKYYFGGVAANGYIYAIAGSSGGGIVSTIYYAKVNANGSLGSWATNSDALPVARMGMSAVAANGYAYVLAGTTVNGSGTGAKSSLYYSKINSNGSLGAWTLDASTMSDNRFYHSSVVANGYIYVMGGYDANESYKSTIYYASTARTLINGSLDLLGLSNSRLSDYGDWGGNGSSIFAGDIFSNGRLEVTGNTQLFNGLSVRDLLSVTASTSVNQAYPIFSIQNATATAPLLSVLYNGNVGIGTTTAAMTNTLTVQGGVCITSGNSCPAVASGALSIDTTGGGAAAQVDLFDIAERYPASEAVGAGDIVAIDPDAGLPATVKRANMVSPDPAATSSAPIINGTLLGVVSSKPAITINGSSVLFGPNDEVSSTTPRVALVGRVPVKVNLEGGEIGAGDRITLSSEAGIGKRFDPTATSTTIAAVQTIGIALESFTADDEDGKVLVFINLGYAPLSVEKGGSADFDLINIKSLRSVANNFSIDENGVLTVKEVHAEKLCLGATCVTETDLQDILGRDRGSGGNDSGDGGNDGAISPREAESANLEEEPPSAPAEVAGTSTEASSVAPEPISDQTTDIAEPVPSLDETAPPADSTEPTTPPAESPESTEPISSPITEEPPIAPSEPAPAPSEPPPTPVESAPPPSL